MAFGARHSRARIFGASALSIALMFSTSAMTQTADTDADRRTEQRKQKQAKRKPAQPQQQAQPPSAAAMNANAQAGTTAVQSLDTITVAASKTEEKAIDALAPVSVVTLEQIQCLQPNRLSDIF